jgi:septal ring factor EnvC (AmiA/AmiB activator)
MTTQQQIDALNDQLVSLNLQRDALAAQCREVCARRRVLEAQAKLSLMSEEERQALVQALNA